MNALVTLTLPAKTPSELAPFTMRFVLPSVLVLALFAHSATAICCVSAAGHCDRSENHLRWTPRGLVGEGSGLISREPVICCCSAGTSQLCLTQC